MLRPLVKLLGVGSIQCACLTSCSEQTAPRIELTVGPDSVHHLTLVPVTATGEYIDLVGSRRELRLVFSTHPVKCGAANAQDPGATVLRVTVVAPPDKDLGPGKYPWDERVALGRTSVPVEKHAAIPVVRRGATRYQIPPGGQLLLNEVALELGGTISGRLEFEFSGEAKQPSTRVFGNFNARICSSQGAAPR